MSEIGHTNSSHMKNRHSILSIVLIALSAASLVNDALAETPAFSFTPQDFQKKFNAIVDEDGGDKIVSLKKGKGSCRALLSDESFQKSVAEFKKLDLANGRFTMKTRIELKMNQEGKVTEVVMSGDRADPINLLSSFVGAVGSAIKVVDPSLSRDQVTKLAMDLGLFRGDDDPTTGTVITQFTKGGAYACLTQQSSVSTVVLCTITPRY